MPRCSIAFAIAALILLPQAAAAQDRTASFVGGASFGDGETAPGVSAALAFSFTPRIGLEFELAYARKLDFTIDLCPPPLVCVRGGEFPVTGRSVSLVPHIVFDLLPPSRLRVFVLGGAGVGHVRQRYFTAPVVTDSAGEPINELTRSNVVAAVSFGGGATMAIARRFAVGGDVRSLHLFDDEAAPAVFITPDGRLTALRVGVRVSWRF
jgi:hypothetical protein